MTRMEWLSALAQARPEVLAALAAPVDASGRAEVIRPAARGILLATVQESVEGAAFHPGEILVTTCEVRMDGAIGHAIILGADDAKAQHCALLDAALQAGWPDSPRILEALRAEEARLTAARHAEHERVQATRVHFDTMDPQR
jgi:alpha-D-ribose 1-methylphosphonate 5-triphosphate synthase subunit PhnG